MDITGADYARQITCPALILQGDKDLFTILPQEAVLLEEAFREGGDDDVTLITFTDLDHVFRPTLEQPSLELYYEDRGPISADVVDALVEWFKETLR
jgi:dipeptidyl aminopeptidase/acylaminoacyl peptidase